MVQLPDTSTGNLIGVTYIAGTNPQVTAWQTLNNGLSQFVGALAAVALHEDFIKSLV
jgi:hypothetical protein